MKTQDKIINEAGAITKAGGIVVKKEKDKVYILMVYRTKLKDWTFPKGHCEKGESAPETVTREVEEECGIKAEIIKELVPNTYFNPYDNGENICYMYLLKPISGEIRPEHKGDIVEWVELDEVADRISYDNLADYFRREVKQTLDDLVIQK